MIELHQFPLFKGVNISPFCLKVETYLRLASRPYRVVEDFPFKGPKGKLPFIVDEHGQVVADSGDIIAHFEAAKDQSPNAGAGTLGHLVRRTLEESLYFAILYDRWLIEENWRHLRIALRRSLPIPLRWFVPALIRRKIRRDLHGQGYGRHTAAQVHARGGNDIAAVAAILGDRDFLDGDRPGAADAGLYAFLVSLLEAGFPGPLTEATRSHSNLVAYHRRMGDYVAALG